MMDFADFIAPFDVGTFRSQYYGNRPVHIRREGHSRPDVLNWTRFNEVLAITPYWNEDTLKVYFKNRAALRENYCDTADLRPGTSAPANPAKVKALMGLGASLIANHLHRVCPEVGAVVSMLELQFAARVVANVYCSFKGVQAFQTHYDLHDVFAFQAEGEKTWRVYEARADAPVSTLPPGDEIEKWLISTRGPLLFEAHMKPGDILYLPRGQYHDALTGSQASLHVTFGAAAHMAAKIGGATMRDPVRRPVHVRGKSMPRRIGLEMPLKDLPQRAFHLLRNARVALLAVLPMAVGLAPPA